MPNDTQEGNQRSMGIIRGHLPHSLHRLCPHKPHATTSSAVKEHAVERKTAISELWRNMRWMRCRDEIKIADSFDLHDAITGWSTLPGIVPGYDVTW